MNTFEITSLQTEEAAASGWTVAGAVGGVVVVGLACD